MSEGTTEVSEVPVVKTTSSVPEIDKSVGLSTDNDKDIAGEGTTEVEQSSSNETATKIPPSKKKVGRVEYSGHEIIFNYYTQDANYSSPILRKNISEWNKDTGVVGILLDNNTLAWSMEAPRHVALRENEGGTVMARFQTTQELWTVDPVIQIDALDKKYADNLIGFFRRSGVRPNVYCKVRTTDDLDTGQSYNNTQVFAGNLSKYQTTLPPQDAS